MLNHVSKLWWRKKEDEFYEQKQQISKTHKARTKRNFDKVQTAFRSSRLDDISPYTKFEKYAAMQAAKKLMWKMTLRRIGRRV